MERRIGCIEAEFMKRKFLLTVFSSTLAFSAVIDGGKDFVYAESYKGVIDTTDSIRASSQEKTERSGGTIGEVLAADSVQIKSIGENSLAAKQKALSVAARRAFSSLLDQYTAELVEIDNPDSVLKEEALPPLSSFSDREINNCVYDYSIDNEKYSESVYICEVRYRFDSKKIISLLQNYNVKCRLSGINKPAGIEVAVYTKDFIRNSSKFPANDCVIKKYSAEYVVIFIKNCTKEKFAKLGLRYALLQ